MTIGGHTIRRDSSSNGSQLPERFYDFIFKQPFPDDDPPFSRKEGDTPVDEVAEVNTSGEDTPLPIISWSDSRSAWLEGRVVQGPRYELRTKEQRRMSLSSCSTDLSKSKRQRGRSRHLGAAPSALFITSQVRKSSISRGHHEHLVEDKERMLIWLETGFVMSTRRKFRRSKFLRMQRIMRPNCPDDRSEIILLSKLVSGNKSEDRHTLSQDEAEEGQPLSGQVAAEEDGIHG